VKIFWGDPRLTDELGAAFTPTPRFVVYARGGALARGLDLDWDAERQARLGLNFARRYTNEVYAVFEVVPATS
jgi:hypothetical protein